MGVPDSITRRCTCKESSAWNVNESVGRNNPCLMFIKYSQLIIDDTHLNSLIYDPHRIIINQFDSSVARLCEYEVSRKILSVLKDRWLIKSIETSVLRINFNGRTWIHYGTPLCARKMPEISD